jgi:hypothetical protein
MTAELHLAENALSLHLLLQRLKGLIDIVVANENLHASPFVCAPVDEKAAQALCACANLTRFLAE